MYPVGLAAQPPNLLASLRDAAGVRSAQQQFGQINALRGLATPENITGFAEGDPMAIARFVAANPAMMDQALPLLRAARDRREFGALFGNAPAAAQGSPPVGGAAPGYANRVAQLESPTGAPNPVSGATGRFQIMPAVRAAYPPGTPEEAIMTDLTRRHGAALRQRLGREPTPDELFTAHRLGPGGALALLTASPDTPLEAVMPQVFDGSSPQRPPWATVVQQNGYLQGAQTVGDVRQRLAQEWSGGGGGAAPGGAPVSRGTMPGMPSPETFARAIKAAAAGNEMAQRYVQLWAPFMRQENRDPVPGRDVPYSPEVLRQRQLLAESGRTAVNVDQRGDTSFAQTYGKTLAEQAANMAAAPRVAAQTQSRLARAERLLERFDTGAFANARLTAGAIAQQMGVPDSVLETLGISKDQQAAGEGIRSIASQLLLGMIGPGGFPAQNFSNADREMLEKAIVSLGNTREGNRQIIASLREAAKLDEKVGRAWLQWSRANGATSESFQRFLDEKVPELTGGVDPYAGLIEAWQSATLSNEPNPGPPGAGAGPGGRGTAEPPPPAGSSGGWSIRPVR